MSDLMKEFFKAYLKWATEGGESEQMKSHVGLCTNLWYWSQEMAESVSLEEELETMLSTDFDGDISYPFGGYHTYLVHNNSSTQHTNQLRLDWVKKQLEK
jgi:hypothetical protein